MAQHEIIKDKIKKINKRTSISHLEKHKLINELYNPLSNNKENNLSQLHFSKPKVIHCNYCQYPHSVFNSSTFNLTHCENCSFPLSYYKCDICNLISEDINIYHCSKCKLCRLGNKTDFIHCDTCNICISKDCQNHTCVENSLEQNCPICCEYMFNSNKPCILLDCGHSIHRDCLQDYLKTDYKCPMCRKAIIDMTSHWKCLKRKVKKDYYNLKKHSFLSIHKIKSYIYCHDCQKKDKTRFHWQYFECHKCKGWNTELLYYK